jgi:excisionase family DNA binding protein
MKNKNESRKIVWESTGKLIPVKEIPDILSVSLATVRSWIFQRRLPVVRLGRKVLVKRSVLERIELGGLGAVTGEVS